MATGKVLQFDPVRGYGFVAADDGGEDVFLHASVLDGDPSELAPGVPIYFQVMAGDRGRKAYNARFVTEHPGPAHPATSSSTPSTDQADTDAEQMCDVLTQVEFRTELTETLISAVPSLNGIQVMAVRDSLVEFGKKHGWIDV